MFNQIKITSGTRLLAGDLLNLRECRLAQPAQPFIGTAASMRQKPVNDIPDWTWRMLLFNQIKITSGTRLLAGDLLNLRECRLAQPAMSFTGTAASMRQKPVNDTPDWAWQAPPV